MQCNSILAALLPIFGDYHGLINALIKLHVNHRCDQAQLNYDCSIRTKIKYVRLEIMESLSMPFRSDISNSGFR